MSALLAHEEVMFSPGMLVRGVIECAARIFWVLGKPGDSPEQILARAYLEEQDSRGAQVKAPVLGPTATSGQMVFSG